MANNIATYVGLIRAVAPTGLVVCLLTLSCLALAPMAAVAIVEPGSEVEFPDEVMINEGETDYALIVTGVGLREKTFMKIDVYAIASYVTKDTDLGENMGAGMVSADVPKELRMNILRDFGREKLINSFSDVINDNYEDTSQFSGEMATFLAYFVDDANDGDILSFSYLPGVGLRTHLNGELKGVITNTAFVEALWSVWFGEKPANKGLREDLLSQM